MKKIMLLCSALLFAALAVPALAQTKALKGDIPFEFSVGSATLPAGSYSVQMRDNVVWLMSDETGKGAAALLQPVSGSKETAPAIEFRKYGERAFLAGVRLSDGIHGVAPSKAERQVSEDAAVASVNITLAKK